MFYFNTSLQLDMLVGCSTLLGWNFKLYLGLAYSKLWATISKLIWWYG